MPDVVDGLTTEDLVDEYPEGEEAELLPAVDSVDLGPPIEPYEGATPVPSIGAEQWDNFYEPRNTE